MKRRITVTVDEDIVEALESLDAESLSAAVNAALREKVDAEMHRRAALAWIEELNARYGRATPDERAEVDRFLDEVGFGEAGSPQRSGAA